MAAKKKRVEAQESTMHPAAQWFLGELGKVAAKAVKAAADSVLEDVEEGAAEVQRRAKRGRETVGRRKKAEHEEE